MLFLRKKIAYGKLVNTNLSLSETKFIQILILGKKMGGRKKECSTH